MDEPETPTPRRMSEEIKAMARIDKLLRELPPASAQRVVCWAQSVTEERVEEEYDTQFNIADDLPEF